MGAGLLYRGEVWSSSMHRICSHPARSDGGRRDMPVACIASNQLTTKRVAHFMFGLATDSIRQCSAAVVPIGATGSLESVVCREGIRCRCDGGIERM